MENKLKLSLDELSVESFPAESAQERETARGPGYGTGKTIDNTWCVSAPCAC